MPIYLKSIGFSVVLIGVLEGFAEATAGLSKGYFGKLSDASGRRVPFVQVGYALSAISKPLMALFVFPLWVFFARTMDRLGKGVRTGARDALLSEEADPETKEEVFGFHRSLDTLGAVIGPSIALVYLYFYPQNYTILFLIAFLPGLLAILATFYLKERSHSNKRPATKLTNSPSFFSFLNYWKNSPKTYRRLVSGLLLFTLFNSSDVFLLLKAQETGMNNTTIVGVYIFYNLIYALFSLPLGIIADRIGLKSIFIFGLLLFATVYFGMSFNTHRYSFVVLFFLYGVYAAATEGVSKAWITNISAKENTATAIGTYTGLQSICTMLASSFTGLIWFKFGANVAFMMTGTATIIVIIYFITVPKPLLVRDK